MSVRLLQGDCRAVLATLPEQSVHCCVTSPPYFGLRDYGMSTQIGLEATPEAFVAELVAVFREVRRVLRDDGTLWLNLGDSYASNVGQGSRGGPPSASSTLEGNGHFGGGPKLASLSRVGASGNKGNAASDRLPRVVGLKPKDLIGQPWLVAFALRADGWYLRQDIIWSKPNPMPESVTDRCTKAHEYLFLLSKSARYHCDMAAIAEPADPQWKPRYESEFTGRPDLVMPDGKPQGIAMGGKRDWKETRNKRSVWEVATRPYSEAHFATFPPALIEPCIKAGCPEGGTVLDPFGGAGTTGLVADRLQRDAILIELNPAYIDIARRRITGDAPLFAEVT